ncbi:MAG: hypothetical protein IJH77_01460, partial [Mogibacterium sp.]|nr:hypothetical protein [Mogibacterium sp.]
ANGDAITLIPRYGFKILKELNLYNFSNLKDVPEIQCNLYLDRMKEVTPALDLFVQFTLSFFHRY